MLQLLDKSRETYRVLCAVATLKCWQEAEQARELAEAATAKAEAATAKAEAATATVKEREQEAIAAKEELFQPATIHPWPRCDDIFDIFACDHSKILKRE